MGIRRAITDDSKAIEYLLEQLDYSGTGQFLLTKMRVIDQNPNALLIVYELEGSIVALMALDCITQLALEGDFARISYFVVDASARSRGIGEEMEAYCTKWARQRGCDRIEVHCSGYRTSAHRFYERCGFVESPKYLIKSLKQ